MDHEDGDAQVPTETLCAVLGRMYSLETGSKESIKISYIIKRANLATPVVLGALFLAVSAREMAAAYIERVKKELGSHAFRKEALEKKVGACLLLCNDSVLLFSISLVVSSKYLVDRAYINRTWSNIFMIDKRVVNEHERTLLCILNHRVDLTEEAISTVAARMRKEGLGDPERKDKKDIRRLPRFLRRIISCVFGPKGPDNK